MTRRPFRALPAMLLAVAVVWLADLFLRAHALPNTFIGDLEVSGMTRQTIRQAIDRIAAADIPVRIQNRVYRFRYERMGIVTDPDRVVSMIFEPNAAPFPLNIGKAVFAAFEYRDFDPPLVFTEGFYAFSRSTPFHFSPEPDEIDVDEEAKRLVVRESEDIYAIDADDFRTRLIRQYSENPTAIEPILYRVPKASEELVLSYNGQLDRIYAKPVTLVLRDTTGLRSSVATVSADQIRELVAVSYDKDTRHVSVGVDPERVTAFAAWLVGAFHLTGGNVVSVDHLTRDLTTLVIDRFNGRDVDTAMTYMGDAPNTRGELATKYIEVDISQQRMYLFESGKLKKSYQISSGLDYPTPTGSFTIKNKITNAWSGIYGVWMPYWMEFYHSPKLNASFGIHELPYWIDKGKRIQRPREFIGSPHTGGCVALDIGKAKEVYQFADVGTPVHIYQ